MTAKPNRRLKTLVMAAMAIGMVSACSLATTTTNPTNTPGSSAAPSSAASVGVAHKPVTISVGALRPGATQEAVDALNLLITEFTTKYPWITVESQEYNWTAPTFTAQLAGGTLPTVFNIPFTDGKGLEATATLSASAA